MPTAALLDLLAQVPASTLYVNPFKLLTMVVLVAGWAAAAQWVDKDTVRVNTFRTIWNLAVMLTGIAAIALLLFLPIFWLGLAAFVLVGGGALIAYVVHRNGIVEPEHRVLTPGHFARISRQGFGGKGGKEAKEVRERVRITGADKRVVVIPAEDPEREQFRLLQDLLWDALWRRASLVELIPSGNASKLQFTVDGEISPRDPLDRPVGEGILSYVKTIAGLNLEERRKPQSGKLMCAMGESKREIQVRTDGSTAGEKLTLRIIGDERHLKVANAGFTEKQRETVQQIMSASNGMVLVSAPKGAGLTSSVYAFARSHDAFLQNIQTLEYTRELELENITQHVFTPEGEKTFVGELQKLFRSDPDIVILPEVRERAVGPIIAAAAAHKQKVYVGIQANDIFDAIRKWLALVGDPALAAKGMLAVANQRLVRVLCTACKVAYKPDPGMLKKINAPADTVMYRPPELQYDKHGNPILCQNCQGTGYVGRTGVFTILTFDEELKDVLKAGGSMSDVQAAALKKGSLSLQQQALHKVFDGTTSIEEVIRVTKTQAAPKQASAAAPETAKPAR